MEGVRGRDATDPRLLLALWVYATIDGVASARELARRCELHLVYKWLCGGVTVKSGINLRSECGLADLNHDFKVDDADLAIFDN